MTSGTHVEPPHQLPDGLVPPSASLNPPGVMLATPGGYTEPNQPSILVPSSPAPIVRDVPVDDVPDFGSPDRNVRFKVNGELFTCPADLPVLSLLEFAELGDKVNEQDVAGARDVLGQMFRIVLDDDSADRFIARLSDKHKPIGLTSMQQVIPYILEKFGLRPTAPSDSSSTGPESPPSGPSLTGNAQQSGSISAGSPPPGF